MMESVDESCFVAALIFVFHVHHPVDVVGKYTRNKYTEQPWISKKYRL